MAWTRPVVQADSPDPQNERLRRRRAAPGNLSFISSPLMWRKVFLLYLLDHAARPYSGTSDPALMVRESSTTRPMESLHLFSVGRKSGFDRKQFRMSATSSMTTRPLPWCSNSLGLLKSKLTPNSE